MIEAHGVDYLAENLLQTTIKMIQTLKDITTIKEFKNYKKSITLEKLKERLSLVKDKKEARYKTECLDQMNFFLRRTPTVLHRTNLSQVVEPAG